ncbi:MAG: antA/AntB antirepressor family protein [Methylobacter sp.]
MTAINTSAPNMASSGTDNLIPVFTADIGGETRPNVDARELHKFLGVKRDFSSWIKKRFTEYQLKEDQDYVSIAKMGDGVQDENLIHQNVGIKLGDNRPVSGMEVIGAQLNTTLN